MLNTSNSSVRSSKIYEQLILREQQWWQTRQHLVTLKQRQIFWYGDSSLMIWLLWQLLSYIVIAIVLMMLNKFLQIQLTLWQCVIVFGLQTLFFIMMLGLKSRLDSRLQYRIAKQDSQREQALNEMIILADDSILPDIHANTPLSLQHIYERYGSQLHRASLQYLLQKEIDAGRMILGSHKAPMQVLSPEFADNELIPYASKMIYKSVI